MDEEIREILCLADLIEASITCSICRNPIIGLSQLEKNFHLKNPGYRCTDLSFEALFHTCYLLAHAIRLRIRRIIEQNPSLYVEEVEDKFYTQTPMSRNIRVSAMIYALYAYIKIGETMTSLLIK